jgi:two-component system cell cycle sensor histidine kinase PleC
MSTHEDHSNGGQAESNLSSLERPSHLVGWVKRVEVWPATIIASAIAVIGSTVLCHAIYWAFDYTPVTFALYLPTVAPAVVAPPLLFVLVKTIEKLGQTQIALHEQAVRAEDAFHTKTRFLAYMSHELRTPLNAILGFAESIRDQRMGPVGTEKYLQYAADIHDSGSHLLSLIDDILDMSKIEAEKLQLRPAWVDLLSVVEECCRLVDGSAVQSDVDLSNMVAPDLPPILADERAVKQVMLNLLSNAVKFTPDGGRVTIAGEQVEDGAVRVVVSDTGIGIPAEHLGRIFDPYVGSDLQDTRLRGSGLGLPLVKSLVELHGGSVRLDSEVGAGTTVTVEFPGHDGAGTEPRSVG